MPRGRRPLGERAMTGAERQARYARPRSRRNTARPSDRARRRARNPSRAAQWEDAVETLIELQQEFQE